MHSKKPNFWWRLMMHGGNNQTCRSQHLLESLLTAIPDDPAHLKELCGTVEDWDELFNRALTHGVESFLYHHLTENGFTLPPLMAERTERWLKVRDLWQSHSQSALDEALQILYAASVPTVVLKGPTLGERLYPTPHTRPSADLDLLVAPADLDRATAALKNLGYRSGNEAQARFLRRYHYHTILSRSCPPVIELHFRLSNSFGVEIQAEDFLSRAGKYRTAQGAIAHILSPEDEMLYLSVHAAGHRFIRLSWLCDINLLVRHYPSLDWATLVARARSLHLFTALLFTCQTLHSRLGTETPLSEATSQGIRFRAANLLLAATERQPDPSRRSLLGKIAFTAVLCDKPGIALEFLQRQLLLIARRRAHRHFPSHAPEEWSY